MTDTSAKAKPDAWLVPQIIDISKAKSYHFDMVDPNASDADRKKAADLINGTVAWGAEVFCDDFYFVVDKHGVKHLPKPLYASPPSPSGADGETHTGPIIKALAALTALPTLDRPGDEYIKRYDVMTQVLRIRDAAYAQQRELAAAQQDSARLDFVLERQAFIVTSPEREGQHGKLYQLWSQDENENLHMLSGVKFFSSERAAIDAAKERANGE